MDVNLGEFLCQKYSRDENYKISNNFHILCGWLLKQCQNVIFGQCFWLCIMWCVINRMNCKKYSNFVLHLLIISMLMLCAGMKLTSKGFFSSFTFAHMPHVKKKLICSDVPEREREP